MQLTALHLYGTLDSVQFEKSPQLMRGPLDGRMEDPCTSGALIALRPIYVLAYCRRERFSRT